MTYHDHNPPRHRSEPVGNFAPPMGVVTDMAPETIHRARLAIAHYTTAHIDPDRELTPAEKADARTCLEALGFLPYPSNRLGKPHK